MVEPLDELLGPLHEDRRALGAPDIVHARGQSDLHDQRPCKTKGLSYVDCVQQVTTLEGACIQRLDERQPPGGRPRDVQPLLGLVGNRLL